ncbi:MAG: hypothetical protein M0D53_06100 [Flavobacterium sp. JAD_PAG50586_2]|nr:MAG: hypothetical protein M0D53_06100 [Flavobacterium sp. JAD_PAG50586_2]
MASTSEVGHAKNIANLNLLNTHIAALGGIYQPSNNLLELSNLQEVYNSAYIEQQAVNTNLAPYTIAVDDREAIFSPLSRQLTKLRKAYKSTKDVKQPQMEDFMTIVRKLKGKKKYQKPAESTDSAADEINHSVSQLSYDQRTNNMDPLISLLENTPNYNPNEEEYKIPTWTNRKALMLRTTQRVADTFIPLNKARGRRNTIVYNREDNLVDLANAAKDYLFSILDVDSVDYKAIARIKFKKR